METKDDTGHLVRMLSAPVQNELGYIDSGRTGCTTGLTVETGLYDFLRIRLAKVLIGYDFEPSPRTHVFRLEHIVHRTDGVTLGAGRTGFRQSHIVDMVSERP